MLLIKHFFAADLYSNPVSSNILPTSSEYEQNYNSVCNITSNSLTLPPVANPLLEMGFTLKHILKAILETKIHGEISVQTINTLATWMLEHPYSENNVDVSSGATGSESFR